MRPLLFSLFGLVLLSCKEEPPPLKFRAPQLAQSTSSPAPQSEPVLIVVVAPKTAPTSTTSQPAEPFSCVLDGEPWLLSPQQKLQGLLLQRPGLSKDQPPTKLITISLQGATNERLLIEIVADNPTLDTARVTLTTKDAVSKGSLPIVEVERIEEAESTRLSFSIAGKLQTLGSPLTRALQACRLQGVAVRSLQAETPAVDE